MAQGNFNGLFFKTNQSLQHLLEVSSRPATSSSTPHLWSNLTSSSLGPSDVDSSQVDSTATTALGADAADASFIPYTTIQATLIGVSASLLSLATISGNLMVMISFKMDKQLQTISNYFLFSLAVADMIIGAVSMPLFTVYIVQGSKWTLGRWLCDGWLSIDYLASNASVLNLLVISFDRYFSVTRPLTYRARRTTKKAALMIFAAWSISAFVWPPWIVAWPYIEGGRTVPKDDCYVQFIYSNEYMAIVTVMIAFFIPVSVMIGLYVRVWAETVKRQKELVHLQAGKKASSKRSDSSDETNDGSGRGNRGGGGWLSKGGFGGGNQLAKESPGTCNNNNQEITYVPTAMLKSRAASNASLSGRSGRWSAWFSLKSLCISCIEMDRGPGMEDPSSEGYMTPRSIETPVAGGCSKYPSQSTLAHPPMIRDPYAPPNRFSTAISPSSLHGGLPTSSSKESNSTALRRTASAEEENRRSAVASKRQLHQRDYQRQSSSLQRAATSPQGRRAANKDETTAGHDRGSDPSDNENIYTILIRFPPPPRPEQIKTSITNLNAAKPSASSASNDQPQNRKLSSVSKCHSLDSQQHLGYHQQHNSHQSHNHNSPTSVAANPSVRQSCSSVTRVPSIQMLPEHQLSHHESLRKCQSASSSTSAASGSYKNNHSRRSNNGGDLTTVASVETHSGGGGGGGSWSSSGNINGRRGILGRGRSNNSSIEGPSTQSRSRGYSEISTLPLDTKLVPRQLVRQQTEIGQSAVNPGAASKNVAGAGGNTVMKKGFRAPSRDSSNSLLSTVSGGVTLRKNYSSGVAAGGGTGTANSSVSNAGGKKKASSEKKQDRKAAKTLSAILLAFIITWTPYSVLVIINAFLGKQGADVHIPEIVWEFSYYLCYINSTVNPILYALCNAAFRRTYIRILTCRWGSRARQPINRYYYG